MQYITDPRHSLVRIRYAARKHEEYLGIFNTPASPFGIAVDAQRNRIYVSLPTQNEIVVYSCVAPYKQLAIIHRPHSDLSGQSLLDQSHMARTLLFGRHPSDAHRSGKRNNAFELSAQRRAHSASK